VALTDLLRIAVFRCTTDGCYRWFKPKAISEINYTIYYRAFPYRQSLKPRAILIRVKMYINLVQHKVV